MPWWRHLGEALMKGTQEGIEQALKITQELGQSIDPKLANAWQQEAQQMWKAIQMSQQEAKAARQKASDEALQALAKIHITPPAAAPAGVTIIGPALPSAAPAMAAPAPAAGKEAAAKDYTARAEKLVQDFSQRLAAAIHEGGRGNYEAGIKELSTIRTIINEMRTWNNPAISTFGQCYATGNEQSTCKF